MILTRTDRRGRSTGTPANSKVKVALGLPKNVGWNAALPADLLNSAAFLNMPNHCFPVLFAIVAEHCAQGGKENGNLICTHNDLVRRGVRRSSIRECLEILRYLGLIDVARDGRRDTLKDPNRYRLCWLGTPDGIVPTNEWKRHGVNLATADALEAAAAIARGIAAVRAAIARNRQEEAERRRTRSKNKSPVASNEADQSRSCEPPVAAA